MGALELAEQTLEQRHKDHTDQSTPASCHQLLDALAFGTGIVIAITFKQVDATPNAQASTKGDDKGLKNVYCAIEKIHNF